MTGTGSIHIPPIYFLLSVPLVNMCWTLNLPQLENAPTSGSEGIINFFF